MALLIAGLADSRLLISEATEDRLHQDYRSPLFPGGPETAAGMAAGGALAVCWSGAGPSLLGICQGTEAAQGAGRRRRTALADAGIPGQVLVLHPDMHGLIVDRDGSADVYDFNAGRRPRPKTTAVPSEPTKDLVGRGQPPSGPRLPGPCAMPRVHLPVPADRPAGLRHRHRLLRARPSLVELKSLKLYLWSYRNEGGFHEDMTNRILDDLVAAVAPRRMTVTTDWLVRGGIHTVVEASYP